MEIDAVSHLAQFLINIFSSSKKVVILSPVNKVNFEKFGYVDDHSDHSTGQGVHQKSENFKIVT